MGDNYRESDPNLTSKEQRLMEKVHAQFMRDDGVLSDIEKRFLDLLRDRASSPGDITRAQIRDALDDVVQEKHADAYAELSTEQRLRFHDLWTNPTKENEKNYADAKANSLNYLKSVRADEKDLSPASVLHQAKQAGLEKGDSMTDQEKHFLRLMKDYYLQPSEYSGTRSINVVEREILDTLEATLKRSGEATLEAVRDAVSGIDQRYADEVVQVAQAVGLKKEQKSISL